MEVFGDLAFNLDKFRAKGFPDIFHGFQVFESRFLGHGGDTRVCPVDCQAKYGSGEVSWMGVNCARSPWAKNFEKRRLP